MEKTTVEAERRSRGSCRVMSAMVSGDWTKGLILTAWGTIVVGGIHLLYPILVRDRLRLHTIPAFISIVGGLLLFGASGLLLGPLIVTATIFFLEVWRVPITGTD